MELIQLSLPLSTRHAATARVVAASLAADAGFSVDEIDDLRLGINEAVAVLTDDADQGGDARLEVSFSSDERRIDVVIRPVGTSGAVEPDDLAKRILSAVVDEFAFADGAFTLSKSSERTTATEDAGAEPRDAH